MFDSRFARLCAWVVACLFASLFFSSSSAVAQACDADSDNNGGTFLSLADQGPGGFGGSTNIEAFLNANGLSGATRVAKINLGQAGDCDTDNGVIASATTNLSGFWKSSEPICAIAIHAGGGQRVAVFTYDPPATSGSWSTSQNLNNQGNQQGISNIQFFKCDQPNNNNKVALKVRKVALDENGNALNTNWSFNFSSPQIGSFPLTNTSPESVTFQIDKDATIEITEAEPAGFDFQDFTCTGPISTNNPAPTRGVSFTVDQNPPDNSEIVCTATNKKKNVGTVSVIKEVKGTNADTSKTFEFFTNLQISSFHLSHETSPKTFEIATNQTVTFQEDLTNLNGYTLQSISCTKNGANFPVNVQVSKIEFDAIPNDNIVCTFVNKKDGGAATANLQVKKIILNPDGSTATNDPQTFGFDVAGSAIAPLGNGQTSPAVQVAADGSSYTVGETANPDYVLTDIDCGAAVHTTNANNANVTPTDSENVLCTFTNRRKGGTLKVVKTTLGGDGTFQFNVTGPTNASFSLQGGGSRDFTNVPAGNYTVSETSLPVGWTLQNIDCGRGTRTNDQINFSVVDGDSVVCTFTNFKEDDDPAEDVTKVFIHRRVDNLLTHGPDRARVLRRLDDQPTGSLKDSDWGSYEPLKFTGSIKDGKGNVKFSTSLNRMRAAAAAEDKKKAADAGLSFNDYYTGYYAPQTMTQRLDLWVEGQVTSYDDTTGGINRDGQFRILYTGVDYAVTPGILVGGLIQIDHTEEDVKNPGLTGRVEGTGWMAGPYLGWKLQENLFFDARAAWGKSSNDIDLTDSVVGRRTGSFDTDRWLTTATLTGNYYHEGLRISPHVGIAYGNEVSDAYKTSLGQNVGAADVTLGKITFGPEFGYRTTLDNGTTVEPHISLKGIWNFDGDTLELSSGPVKIDDFRAQVEAGVIVKSVDGYSFRAAGSYDGIGDSNLDAWSAKGWLNIPLD